MSDSGLKLPATTELEGRVREALKVAREGLMRGQGTRDPYYTSQYYEDCIERITDILEDGRS
jgi:hypothetical protein